MKRQAYAKSRDKNEPDIVSALEAFGASVMRIDNFDLLVGYKGEDTKIEVKNPDTDWKLTASQVRLVNEWKGSPLFVVTSAEQAINVIKRRALK